MLSRYFPSQAETQEINSKRSTLQTIDGMFEIPFYSCRCKTNFLLDHFPNYLRFFSSGSQCDLHQIEKTQKERKKRLPTFQMCLHKVQKNAYAKTDSFLFGMNKTEKRLPTFTFTLTTGMITDSRFYAAATNSTTASWTEPVTIGNILQKQNNSI